MVISYSFHLSKGKTAITSKRKLVQSLKHILRKYRYSKEYDKNKIQIICGSDQSLLGGVQDIYHEQFDEALTKYNDGKRPDRWIHDYFDHVSKSSSDVACEIIIQLGDRDFWNDKSYEERQVMTAIYKDQLATLQDLVPELKIASAVIHYDESSPHMHIIGVPCAGGFSKGLECQVSKTKVFTRERLGELQEKLHERAAIEMNLEPLFNGCTLKDKEKGRNKDIPKYMLDEYYAVKRETQELSKQKESVIKETLDAKYRLYKAKKEENAERTHIEHLQGKKAKMESEIDGLKEQCTKAAEIIEAAGDLRDEVNVLASQKKILSAAKVKKIDKKVKPALLNKDKVILDREAYEALIGTARAAKEAIKENEDLKYKEYRIMERAQQKADQIIKEANDNLCESIDEKGRRLSTERKYNELLADPNIQKYLEQKAAQYRNHEQELDYPDTDIEH